MRVLAGLFALVLLAAGTIYEGTSLFLQHSSLLVDASERTKLAAIMPQLLAVIGTVTAALVGGGVALINWLAQRDLATVQSKYLRDLEAKKTELNGQLEDKKATLNTQLEEKKSALSIELEREKAQFDVLKSEVSRNLLLFQRSIDVISKYAHELRTLRRGLFDINRIEEREMEMRSLLVEFDQDKEPRNSIQILLTNGIFVKERAERRSTPQGYKELWAELVDGEQIRVTFARFEGNALIAIRRAREACLTDNALTAP